MTEVTLTLTGDRNCKTCKWWGANQHSKPLQRIMSKCTCPMLSTAIVDMPETPAGAMIDGGDDVQPVFVTGPDFGCVHHAQLTAKT